ncbi:MAG: SGNH/GDSL hydrolase family protein [Candidatus Omnitrophica bacterium]|nr:SGNH/GDSL hydrolase family protein [Candidatus Omnitrophota bacterium]
MLKSSHGKIRFFFLYMLFSVIFIFAALECFVRLLHLAPLLPVVRFVEDPYMRFKTRPLSRFTGLSASREFAIDFQHNSLGFRDIEHSVNKPDGVFRILGLGDSFTYGAGVFFEDTYLLKLEQMLNKRSGQHPKVEIIKAGIPRFYPETERLLLEHYGLNFKPDLIIVGFVRNDVIDTFYGIDGVGVAKDGYLLSGNKLGQINEVSSWLYSHSHLFRIVVQRYRDKEDFLKKVADTEKYRDNGFLEKEWGKIEQEYDKMIELSHRNNSKIVFFNIPQDASWATPPSTYPPQRLSAWARSKEAPFIDITPAMQAASKKAKLYWKIDGHCNSAGYQVVADTLFSELTKAGLVP